VVDKDNLGLMLDAGYRLGTGLDYVAFLIASDLALLDSKDLSLAEDGHFYCLH
jgi:hypothetical protein